MLEYLTTSSSSSLLAVVKDIVHYIDQEGDLYHNGIKVDLPEKIVCISSSYSTTIVVAVTGKVYGIYTDLGYKLLTSYTNATKVVVVTALSAYILLTNGQVWNHYGGSCIMEGVRDITTYRDEGIILLTTEGKAYYLHRWSDTILPILSPHLILSTTGSSVLTPDGDVYSMTDLESSAVKKEVRSLYSGGIYIMDDGKVMNKSIVIYDEPVRDVMVHGGDVIVLPTEGVPKFIPL